MIVELCGVYTGDLRAATKSRRVLRGAELCGVCTGDLRAATKARRVLRVAECSSQVCDAFVLVYLRATVRKRKGCHVFGKRMHLAQSGPFVWSEYRSTARGRRTTFAAFSSIKSVSYTHLTLPTILRV